LYAFKISKAFFFVVAGWGLLPLEIEPQPALKVLAVELQSILDDNTISDVPHYHYG
jgi:hypothetical protein